MTEVHWTAKDRAVVDGFARALLRLDPELQDALRDAGELVARRERDLVPRAAVHRGRGKRLADSIRVRVTKTRARVVTSKRQAAVLERGYTFGPMTIRPSKRKALHWTDARGEHFASVANVGPRTIRAHWYAKRARDETFVPVRERIEAAVDAAIERYEARGGGPAPAAGAGS